VRTVSRRVAPRRTHPTPPIRLTRKSRQVTVTQFSGGATKAKAGTHEGSDHLCHFLTRRAAQRRAALTRRVRHSCVACRRTLPIQQVRYTSHCWHARCFMLSLQAYSAANLVNGWKISGLKELIHMKTMQKGFTLIELMI